MRIDEILYTQGFGTRRVCAGLVQQGFVTVDGAAGPATLAALYSANVVPAQAIAEERLTALNNTTRELEEQRATGAIQGSLAGGGVAASYNNTLYYAGGSNGSLYMSTSGGAVSRIYDAPVGFVHATAKGVTFVSDGKIMRVPLNGGTAQTIVSAGGIKKLALLGETMYYLEGNALVKASSNADATVLMTGVTDFTLDVYQYTAYLVTDAGVMSLSLTTGGERLLVSTAASQAQVCDSVVFFRSGGRIYRLQDGVSVQLIDAEATWMGIYRDMIYYISGDRLYRCETTGQNSQVFYDGQAADVSFVAGKVYITQIAGGPVAQVLPV